MDPAKMNLISSWSGGKDSCLALYKARQQGYQIRGLLNFISAAYKRCCFHGLANELMHAQAHSLGIPLFQKAVPPDMAGYEEQFKFAVIELKTRGLCPCGENGEFHTFVYDGPIFKKKINIWQTAKILRAGFWKHWFLDIKVYATEDK